MNMEINRFIALNYLFFDQMNRLFTSEGFSCLIPFSLQNFKV
jgi:hypothetical protein